MVMKFFETELRYVENFSQRNTHVKGIDYYDDRLPDMYAHNFTFLESIYELDEEIDRLISERKEAGKTFLRIETVLPIRDELLINLSVVPVRTVYDMMAVASSKYQDIKRREDVTVKRLESVQEYAELIEADVLSNKDKMGEDFARKRIKRKIEVYRQGKVECYGCYLGDRLMGSCEMFQNGDIAKVEDFDIVPNHQRQGLGTTLLSHVMEIAHKRGVQRVYLLTDQADTAKEMYEKNYFVKVAEKFDWFFDL